MINGKQFADVLDYLATMRQKIEGRSRELVIMVCEHQVHGHVACGERLYRAADCVGGGTGPYTTRWVTCPIAGHRSRHFFLQANGRTHPAPCRMHPLPANLPVKRKEDLDALDAATRIGGHEALVSALQKHVRFDPFYWRLWDLVAYHQRSVAQGEYAG